MTGIYALVATAGKSLMARLGLSVPVPLYKGAPSFWELYKYIEDKGYRCIGLTQGFANLGR